MLERKVGRKRERVKHRCERETSIGCLPYVLPPWMEFATEVYALTRKGPCNLLVSGMMLQPTEPPGQGMCYPIINEHHPPPPRWEGIPTSSVLLSVMPGGKVGTGNHVYISLKERTCTLSGVAQWIEHGLQTKGSPVWFPVRAHAWVAGQVPNRGCARGNHTLMFLSPPLSFSFPSLLSK